MFLALDIGNSSVKAAVWNGGTWGDVVRFPSEVATAQIWAARLHALAPVRHVGIASVVPALTTILLDAADHAFGVRPTLISADLPLPFRMAYRTPATLGADRLAAAAAAWTLYAQPSRPIVAIDAGTAVTLDVVNAESAYLGGAIAPGPDLLRKALARDTGQLPLVDWTLPPSVIGGSTAEAIQSGLTGLFLDGVSGLLARTAAALGSTPIVVATGGWGPWLAEHGLPVDVVAPTLVLDGIRLLTEPPR